MCGNFLHLSADSLSEFKSKAEIYVNTTLVKEKLDYQMMGLEKFVAI